MEISQTDRITLKLTQSRERYFLDTGVYNEALEEIIRRTAARIAFYADEFFGDSRLFDPTGRYLCGGHEGNTDSSCNKFLPDPGGSPVGNCTLYVGDINGVLGGCDYWIRFAGPEQPELLLCQPYPRDQGYVEHRDGEGFGCVRCIHAAEAKRADSKGRATWCRWWGMRVTQNACCKQNMRTPAIIFKDNQAVLVEKSDLNELLP